LLQHPDYLQLLQQEINDHLSPNQALTCSTRLGEPDDIAAMVAFLFSDDSAWINGQVISVDGGATLR
jgi:NAD(P)-dependent dehydrogenase (short-subunit alcohol dehydrogenase family)